MGKDGSSLYFQPENTFWFFAANSKKHVKQFFFDHRKRNFINNLINYIKVKTELVPEIVSLLTIVNLN